MKQMLAFSKGSTGEWSKEANDSRLDRGAAKYETLCCSSWPATWTAAAAVAHVSKRTGVELASVNCSIFQCLLLELSKKFPHFWFCKGWPSNESRVAVLLVAATNRGTATAQHSKYSCCFCVSLSLWVCCMPHREHWAHWVLRLRIAFIGFLQIFNGFQVDALLLSSHFIILFVPPACLPSLCKGLPFAFESVHCGSRRTTAKCYELQQPINCSCLKGRRRCLD